MSFSLTKWSPIGNQVVTKWSTHNDDKNVFTKEVQAKPSGHHVVTMWSPSGHQVVAIWGPYHTIWGPFQTNWGPYQTTWTPN